MGVEGQKKIRKKISGERKGFYRYEKRVKRAESALPLVYYLEQAFSGPLASSFASQEERWCDRSGRINRRVYNEGCKRIVATSYTSHDAVEEARRHLEQQRRISLNIGLHGASSRKDDYWKDRRNTSEHLDALTMKIKQAFPAVPLIAIREDLEKTQDANATCERITTGKINLSEVNKRDVSLGSEPQQWYRTYKHRKWNLIEKNRAKYLKRVSAQLSDIEISESER
ncbi:unnamed protein product [Gongylonema pulchrum]|uniref:CUE domain-containing protein n=1 Tax=Gongylonema pulchrum TaxID=637853 RepID=A0A183D586_9BILA|nr:unnamed protein product [Gongylonema pulchrum]